MPKQRKSVSPSSAAAALVACTLMGADKTEFTDLDDEQVQAIVSLIHLTNAAIIINWLEILEGSLSDPEKSRASAILEEFKVIAFAGAPLEEQRALAKELQWLRGHSVELQRIADDRTMSKSECSRQMLGWSKGWLAKAFKDQDLLKRVSLLHGIPLMVQVKDSIGVFRKSIEMVLFPEDAG